MPQELKNGQENKTNDCCIESNPPTKKILKNLAIMTPCYYIVFYSVTSVLHAIFRLSVFDAKAPFNFKQCCLKTSKDQVTGLSLLVTDLLSTLLLVFVTTQRFWDYAITVTIIHVLLSCLVMLEFSKNWQWWITILIGLAIKLNLGEITSLCIRWIRRKRQLQLNLSR